MLVNGARLEPDPSGALYWPAERLLVVSDLHFEKGSAMAARGLGLIPPYDTATTLARLERLVAHHRPRLLIALGDSFHDAGAFARLSAEERHRLAQLAGRQETIWIAGNHDPAPPAELGGTVAEEVAIGPLVFRHEPRPGPSHGEVAGHLHPKARVLGRGRQVSSRCFASDELRVIVPAFGAYAGGLDVWEQPFRPLLRPRFHAWMLVAGKVFAIPAARLARRVFALADGGVVAHEGQEG